MNRPGSKYKCCDWKRNCLLKQKLLIFYILYRRYRTSKKLLNSPNRLFNDYLNIYTFTNLNVALYFQQGDFILKNLNGTIHFYVDFHFVSGKLYTIIFS